MALTLGSPAVETILVVDDDSEVRAVAREILQREGYTVLDTADPREALQIARGHGGGSIDLLLTDVVMPEMNGREIADQLAALRPQMKVVFISGYSVSDTLVPVGAPVVAKPFTPEGLAGKVREVLDYRSPFGRRVEGQA
jgi:CheY-like chemotaxis protein